MNAVDTTFPGMAAVIPPAGARVWPPLAPVSITFVHERRPIADVHMRSCASRAHPLHDTLVCLPLGSGGDLVLAVGDATTHAQNVRPEDAAHVNQQGLLRHAAKLQAAAGAAPLLLTRVLHAGMREWLAEQQGVVGVAQTLCHIGSGGHVVAASVGDCQALVYRPGSWLRRPRLDFLTAAHASGVDGQRLKSCIGQTAAVLPVVMSVTQLARGDILVLGSDGGLPDADADRSGLLRLFDAYEQGGLATLAALAEALDARARRRLTYDDDRSLAVLEKL